MEWMIGLLCFIVFILLLALHKESKLKDEYLRRYKKWEQEYWLLRSHSQDYLDIHVSWLPRGEDNCIKPKETK